ncbi:MAG: DUF6587 family protein [Telluria sp.]
MLEYAIVGLIVAAAAFFAARKFMPASWRKRVSYRLGGSESALGRIMNSDPSCGSGCDTCKACADPEPMPETDGAKRVIKIHKS